MIDHSWILGIVNRPGDLIEYVRGPFSHWAVYLGYNQIAHLPGPSNLFANFQVRNFFVIN
jgi:cell wall-associated NlpC family hydrolase